MTRERNRSEPPEVSTRFSRSASECVRTEAVVMATQTTTTNHQQQQDGEQLPLQPMHQVQAPVAELEDLGDQNDGGPEVQVGPQGRRRQVIALPRLFASASLHGNRCV